MKICINEIENRTTFKIKSRQYIKLLTPETISIEEKTIKHKIYKNLSQLEITEVKLVHCNLVNNTYQLNLRFLHTFAQNRAFGQRFQ